MTRFILVLCLLTAFAGGAAAQEAPPSPTVDPQPSPTWDPQPSPSPPETSAPPEPSAPSAPSEDVPSPTQAPETDAKGEASDESAAVAEAAPSEGKEVADETGEAQAPAVGPPSVDATTAPDDTPAFEPAFVCLMGDGGSPAFLECVFRDGTRHRFELATPAEPLAEQSTEVSGSAMTGPLEVGFVQTRALWPLILVVGIVGIGAGAWTAAYVKPSRASATEAAQEFLRSLERNRPPTTPAQEPTTRLERLVERTVAEPMDAEAQLELAAELFDRGEDEIALRTFERAVHLRPEILLVFLQEPRYAAHRDRPAVRTVLRNVWRDRERCLASYV